MSCYARQLPRRGLQGWQLQYDGLGQNLYVPSPLAGAGEVPFVLTVDGVTANVVTVSIK
jgi:hypothetical protein